MKTLLLALVVVAFMCLDSVSSNQLCFQCNEENYWDKCVSATSCPNGESTCYTKYKRHKKFGMRWAVKGCARACPNPQRDEIVNCCYSPECNILI
uniref:3FTx-Dis2 n=1 Tax=Dispholidus typus TaxID=46295 RepID=A7X3T2_DISTY|nr:3FTx-Dis2 [Dispholidus typus]